MQKMQNALIYGSELVSAQRCDGRLAVARREVF
jgi:hypothetical protein